MRHRRIVSLMCASLLAVGLAGTITPAAEAAPSSDTWGYVTTPKKADGSLDFTDPAGGWTDRGSLAMGTMVGFLNLQRSGIDYTIAVTTPYAGMAGTPYLLVANTIDNRAVNQTWSYSYSGGTGSTSGIWVTTAAGRAWIQLESVTYYSKSEAGTLAVAVTGTATVVGAAAPNLLFSEVLDVTNDGRLVHNLTFTNIGSATMTGAAFSALLDTDLNRNDNIPIMSNGDHSAYIDDGDARLYLDLLKGGQMLAGPWPDAYSGTGLDALNDYVSVTGIPQDSTVFSGRDTAVYYGLDPVDLAPGQSVSLAFDERLYAPTEIGTVNVVYVDDDNHGAVVPPDPAAVTLFSGDAGQPVGFTSADAIAPAGYAVASIDNVATFTDSPQTITVHLVQQVTEVSVEVTRTITFVGTVNCDPAPVVQSVTWTGTTNALTHETTYTTTQAYPAVTSPAVSCAGADFVPDIATVPATTVPGSTTTLPANTTVTVTYSLTPLTTTRTIHYQGAGTATPADVVQSQTWTRTVDPVSGDIVYADAIGLPAVTSPVLPGYTVNPAAVPAVVPSSGTTAPVDTTAVVTYTAFGGVSVVYVDDDASGAVVAPDPAAQISFSGSVGEPVGFTPAMAIAPAGYTVGSIDNVDTFSAAAQTITVHLVHHLTQTEVAVTRTIQYTGTVNCDPPALVQSVTWTATTDDVTQATTYTAASGYPAVPSPAVSCAGADFTADPATVAATPTPGPATTLPANTTVTVAYSLTPVTTTRTIHYQGAGSDTPPDVVQTQTWQRAVDAVSGDIVYTDAVGLPAVDSPVVDKYIVDVATVGAIAPSVTTTEPTDSTRTVTYTETSSVTVVYVDDDASGATVPPDSRAVVAFSGNVGDPVGFSAADAIAPVGYVVATIDNVDRFTSAAQTITVHLTHHLTQTQSVVTRTITYTGTVNCDPAPVVQSVTWTGTTDDISGATTYRPASGYPALPSPAVSCAGADFTANPATVPATAAPAPTQTLPANTTVTVTYRLSPITTSRTIHYQGAGALTPPDVVQSLTWDRTVDPVTGDIVYANAEGFDAVATPPLDQYVVDIASVDATGPTTTTTRPVDLTVTVTYTETSSVAVVYVDDDASGATVPPDARAVIAYSGNVGDPVGFTAADAVAPVGYVVASIDNVDSFTSAAQTITVHLVHHLTEVSAAVTRTITYSGTVNCDPTPVVQSATWTGTTDDVTGQTTYTTTSGYAAVPSPAVACAGVDFVVDPATVPATAVPGPADHLPANTTVAVTYSLTPLTTTWTVHYQGAGQATPADVVQTVAWDRTVDPASGDIVYSRTTELDPVATPAVANYTVDAATVTPALADVSSIPPTNTTVTVTYTAIPVVAPTGGAVAPATPAGGLAWLAGLLGLGGLAVGLARRRVVG